MKAEFKSWLINQQEILDAIIADAASNYLLSNKGQPNFSYDIKKCHEESYLLIQGKDLCYDRPNTAFSYSLWYHARRVNTFISFFAEKLFNLQGQHVEIFDLGAGAGAVQWALGLVYVGLKKLGLQPPKITLINVDTSPFMLHYNRDYLWQAFLKQYPEIDAGFQVRYSVNSWSNEENLNTSNPWLVSSYLFDISDNKIEIARDFMKLIAKYNPSTVLLLTSSQPEKREFLKALEAAFHKSGYTSSAVGDTNLLFNKPITKTNALRLQLGQKLNVDPLQRAASWSDYSYSGLILTKQQAEMGFGQKRIDEIKIFNPPITVRREVQLNPQQIEASGNSDRAVVIVGPAGCGKSIVITERIKNIVEAENYNPNLKILLTTFNKGLLGRLAEWLNDILDKERYTFKTDTNFYGYADKSSHFTFKGSNRTNIRLLHFDMLPKFLGNVTYNGLVVQQRHFDILDAVIQEVKTEHAITDDRFDMILNHDFLFEEYHRVVYGLQYFTKEQYLKERRVGRGNNPSLPRNSQRRELVWTCVVKYYQKLTNTNTQSFTTRRQELLSKVRKGEVNVKFDYILVDEFQDCTNADFEIFFRMLDNPDRLIIAGDLAQAVHIGTAARVPRDERMARRKFFRLEGSYRLPVRISECIKGLSDKIVEKFDGEEGVNGISPYKASPPGARPVIVYAPTLAEIGEKIKNVFATYKIYDLKRACILEKDLELCKELNRIGVGSETDTILSLKGLEKECVIWSTRIPLEYEKEVYEFAYTILTRTSSILIIALSDNTQEVYKATIGLLKRDRLIFWDKATEDRFESFCKPVGNITVVDEA
jgi:hypothetical protein